MIPDDVVEEVRERADIVEVVGEQVKLKRSGKEFKALCPFHKEKTPSFYVVPAKGFYKCFGCGASGDVFSFLMEHVGLDFQESVRQLARRVGVEIPEPGQRRGPDPHQTLREAIAFAADRFTRNLWDDDAGERARRYLERRGVPREAAERCQLGWAPDEWRALREAAGTHGFDDDVLLDAGLVKESERAEEPYDRFRGRLVFPITGTRGRVIAFGGRLLGDGPGPKYLNSPETPIYHKSSVLYGLAWSKNAIRRAESALVVEGYMDYVSLVAHGIENVVAPLGTAMTAEQASLLARYSKRVLLLYDSDSAGLRATFRSGDALLAAQVQPLVVTLPEGEDPDSVVRAGGGEALAPFLKDAVDVLDRKLQILERRGYLDDVDKLRKALDGLLPTLRAAADPALRDIYVARVAERTGVRRETLEEELERATRNARRRRSTSGVGRGRRRRGPSGRRAADAPARRGAAPGVSGQRKLLLLLLRDEARIPRAAELLEADHFTDAVYRELFEMLVGTGGLKGTDPASLELTDGARERLAELRGDPEELHDGDRIFQDSVDDIRRELVYRKLDKLQQAIKLAESEGNEERVKELLREKRDLVHSSRSPGYASERLIRKQRGS